MKVQMKKPYRILAVVILALFMLIRGGMGMEKIAPDPRAEELINRFVNALLLEDESERMMQLAPLLHHSLLKADGKVLAESVKDFSYKKACSNAGFYKVPVVITQVHKKKVNIGTGDNPEIGRIDNYFLEKKDGVAGIPAPVNVFWPVGSQRPVIYYMGSL